MSKLNVKPIVNLQNYYRQVEFYNSNKLILKSKIKGLSESLTNKRLDNHSKYYLSTVSRYHLLAYAFLRRKDYKSVENKCADYNKPNPELLAKFVKQSVNTLYVSESSYQYTLITPELIKEWLDAK